jgi:hypothetical protein
MTTQNDSSSAAYKQDREEMHRLAGAFRHAAANPAETTLPDKWVEGFTDGLRFAAAALDVLAEGNPAPDAVSAAMRGLG